MRVLFACGGSYISGAEIVELSVMHGLQARGHTLRCLTNAWNDGDFHERLEEAGIPYRAIPLGMVSKSLEWKHIKWTLDALVHLPQSWYGYWQELRRFQPDLIVHSGFVEVSLLRPLVDPARTLFHVHGMPGESLHTRRVLNGPDHSGCAYIAVSEAVGRALREQGVPRDKVHVVQNGIAPVPAAGAEKNDESEAPVRIGIIGQVGAWKGHDDLTEALRLLRRRGCSFTCDIVGSGEDEYVQALQNRIARYELDDHVRWRGFVKDQAAIYAPLDVCVVPSRFREPFGLVAAEAGWAGLPVVAARWPAGNRGGRRDGFPGRSGAAEATGRPVAETHSGSSVTPRNGRART